MIDLHTIASANAVASVCTVCHQRPRLGALSRCAGCIREIAEAYRQGRARRAAARHPVTHIEQAPAPRRPPGRPPGITYRDKDRPLHEEMRRLRESGEVLSLTAAAWRVVDRAYGPNAEKLSKVTRLVRTYPFAAELISVSIARRTSQIVAGSQ